MPLAQPDRQRSLQQCPGREKFIEAARPLDAEIQDWITKIRARHYGIEVAETESMSSRAIIESMEKIHLEPDFLPARFLRDGSERSSAVCRIRTQTSFGTGFLIGRGMLMTNNHVIESADEADGSVAEFDFEDGRAVRRVAINPTNIFITNKELDYTIVGCDDQTLLDVTPIPLLRNPALVTQGERVNIIQHPRARAKEVAIHDNRVEQLLDRVVRYRTDTEPGSSGSPVFNNQWELVGLHHAGVSQPGGKAENEAVLISAIINDLIARSLQGVIRDRGTREVLKQVEGTSPMLGFFDVAGLYNNGLEVQVDSFTGDRDFADVGFWNIEHFNDNVADSRISAVADVFKMLSLDVYGLSEVEEGALKRLVEEMQPLGFNLDFIVEDAVGSQDLAVLFDRDTTKVNSLNFLDARLDEKIQGKNVFPRKPLFARCVVEETTRRSTEFIMIVVHLKAFGDRLSQERRRRAAEIMVEIIDELQAQHGLPIVFGGDFNEQLTTNVLQSIKDASNLFTTTTDDAANNSASFIDGRKSLIDHIVVSSDVKMGTIQGDDTAIVRLDRSVATFADDVSDHVPLVFRMVLGDGTNPHSPSDGAVHSNTNGQQTIRIPRGTQELRLLFS